MFSTKFRISLWKTSISVKLCQHRSYTIPALTKDNYPDVKRGSFNRIETKHMNFFKDLLGETRLISEENECLPYNTDWIRANRGYSSCVLKPKTTEEVCNILKYCYENCLAVCPQGGNTGLVGGSVPVFDEIVLSTSLMNKIISFDETSGVLTCEAGCVLENLENFLEDHDHMMPLDLGAKGSCQIGGNVSTNAGGLRLLKYGNLHGSVLGLEAATANGEIVDCLSSLKKDNTGFHLKHLFIGSEGTLGVVTKVVIYCPPKPRAVNLAFLGMESFENILTAVKRSKQELGEIMSCCELIDAQSLSSVTDNFNLKSPLNENYRFYLLIETHGSDNTHDEEKLNRFLIKTLEDKIVSDGVTTNEPSKMKNIWELRERITSGLLYDGYVYKYDLSLPLKKFYSIVDVMKERIGNDGKVTGYGHIGDGNIHLNITTKEFSRDILKKIEPFVYEYTSKLGGSISAEHGIGFRKSKYIHYSKSENAINTMKNIKAMMDHKGILNPYKVLP